MKRSVEDPDGFEWLVYCDGNLLEYCTEADDEEGWAKCLHITGENNQHIFIPWNINEDEPYVDTVKGKIEFKHFQE